MRDLELSGLFFHPSYLLISLSGICVMSEELGYVLLEACTGKFKGIIGFLC